MITHRPKGRMCMNCKHAGINNLDANEINCPTEHEFKTMKPIGKDKDGMIVVKCVEFGRGNK